MSTSGLSEYDSTRGNILEQLRELQDRIARLERWAAPVAARELPNPPGMSMAMTETSQSIPNAAITPLTNLTDEVYEDGLEQQSNHIIRLRRESEVEYYQITMRIRFAANSTGRRAVYIDTRNINSGAWSQTRIENKVAIAAPNPTVIGLTYTFRMAATEDAVRISVYQNSGAALNVTLAQVTALCVKSSDALGQ